MQGNRITQSIIVGSATLIAAITWAGLHNFLFGRGNWLWPLLGFLVLLIFLGIDFLLSNSKIILFITLFILLISFFVCFGFKIEYLGAFSLSLILFMLGALKIIKEKKSRIKLNIYRILKSGLALVLTALVLIIATAYYFSPLSIQKDSQIKISQTLFNFISPPFIQLFKEQMTEQISSIDLSQMAESSEINNKEEFFSEEELISDEEIRNFLYQTLNQQINKAGEPYKDYFPLGMAIGLFFILKGLSIPFGWIVIFLTWLIFKLLVSIGAVKIQEESVLKEVIEI